MKRFRVTITYTSPEDNDSITEVFTVEASSIEKAILYTVNNYYGNVNLPYATDFRVEEIK